jgi:hypothetical protein
MLLEQLTIQLCGSHVLLLLYLEDHSEFLHQMIAPSDCLRYTVSLILTKLQIRGNYNASATEFHCLVYFKPPIGIKMFGRKKICGPLEKLFVLYGDA